MKNSDFSLDFKRAYQSLAIHGYLKACPKDFQVTELQRGELSGEGEHVWLHWQKTGINTQSLARDLARLAKVAEMDVGYAGMKDRQAVTSQWFSVYLPGAVEPDWTTLETDKLQLLTKIRHRKKLRRGQHDGNCFTIRLTSLEGDTTTLQQRLEMIKTQGVPNYFGLQRFGIAAGNLTGADQLFVARKRPPSRHLRGIYISAARSYLFNRLLSSRVSDMSWRTLESGDLACTALVPMPTGPLWGRGRLKSSGRIAELESQAADELACWCRGLEHCGLQQERRSLCLPVKDLTWSLDEHALQLSFELPSGGYATSVVHELGDFVAPGPESMRNLKRGGVQKDLRGAH